MMRILVAFGWCVAAASAAVAQEPPPFDAALQAHLDAVHARDLGLRARGTIVRGRDEHLIVTLGISDLIVVHTPDATLVANKHDEESIRQLVKMIADRGWQQYL